jgi:hypothetical protein
MPLLSFEELGIPPRIQKRIEDAVGDEETLWIGRQDPEARLKKARIGTYAGIGLVVLGVLIFAFAYMMAEKAAAQEAPKETPKEAPKEAANDPPQDAPKEAEKTPAKGGKKKGKDKTKDTEEARAKAAEKEAADKEARAKKAAEKEAAREAARVKAAEKEAADKEARAKKATEDRNRTLLIGGLFAGLLWLMALPLIFLPALTRRFMHNRNCYIITPSRALVVGYLNRKEYDVADLKRREVVIRSNGVGNIIMGYETDTHYDPKGRKSVRTEAVGFMDVAEAAEVEQFLQQTLRLPPPAKYKEEG